MTKIKFYCVNDQYGEFSNFAPFPFSDGETIWPTSEHYFQAQKFLDKAIQEKIRNLESPMAAALEGRNRNNPLRADSEDVIEYIKMILLICEIFILYVRLSEMETTKQF